MAEGGAEPQPNSTGAKQQTPPKPGSCEELQFRLSDAMLSHLNRPNPGSLHQTASCVCCGCNFTRAFELQASLVRLFARRDNCSSRERRYLIQGDLIAWTVASVGCDAATALETLDSIRRTYRRLQLTHNRQCSVCLHRPGFHSIRMAGSDCQGRPVVHSAFDVRASLGLTSAGLPSYLAHLFNCISDSLRFLPATQHGVCLFFDCAGLGSEHYTVENVGAVAEVLQLLPCRVAYVILCRLKYLHRRLLTPLLYLTRMQSRVIFLSSGLSRDDMKEQLVLVFPQHLADWILQQCRDDIEAEEVVEKVQHQRRRRPKKKKKDHVYDRDSRGGRSSRSSGEKRTVVSMSMEELSTEKAVVVQKK